ncbi:hypothetical protein ANANG_G00096210 [Anguilla anguilla]|uniref:Secreted protein n=1 Tax=Anguilla anguilla TaxID=7936 RepID=A0A9D3MHY3_ANGAN|nr:hypothetical protein ANANG_G00096210 [Anguilla anguilla]
MNRFLLVFTQICFLLSRSRPTEHNVGSVTVRPAEMSVGNSYPHVPALCKVAGKTTMIINCKSSGRPSIVIGGAHEDRLWRLVKLMRTMRSDW